jgi:hypothetical protein
MLLVYNRLPIHYGHSTSLAVLGACSVDCPVSSDGAPLQRQLYLVSADGTELLGSIVAQQSNTAGTMNTNFVFPAKSVLVIAVAVQWIARLCLWQLGEDLFVAVAFDGLTALCVFLRVKSCWTRCCIETTNGCVSRDCGPII